MTRARSLLVSTTVAGALLALSGCGTNPGAAAVAGGETITVSQVDAAAKALCSANISGAEARGEARPELAARGARQAALQVLLDSELTHQFGESRDLRPRERDVSAAIAGSARGVAMLPEGEREDFRDLIRGFEESRDLLLQVGEASLAEQGTTAPSPDQAGAEGTKLRDEWAQDVEVEVDPRYGSYVQGSLRPGGGSLSIPVSKRAREGRKAEPGASWVSGLPMSQKCR